MAKPIVAPPTLSDKDIQRFWGHVDRKQPNECWPWKKSCTFYGYGQFMVTCKPHVHYPFRANRIAFLLTTGEWPPEVAHTCDNPVCVNPSHLFAATHKENMNDGHRKGRVSDWRGERNVGAKLTTAKILAIRRLYATGKWTQARIGRKFGVHANAISRIILRQRWGHVQ